MEQIRHEESPGARIEPLPADRRAALEASVPELSPAYRRRQRKRYLRWRLIEAALRPWRASTPAPRDAGLGADLAIAVIAVGPRYRLWARVLASGLADIGGYAGTVYIVTDRAEDFSDLAAVETIAIAGARHPMVIKTVKTFLHVWVPARYVLYLDADILAGGDVSGWCRQALACMHDHAALFYPDPSERRMPYHGGLMLIDSERADTFFRDWRRALASGRFRQDQEALLACAEGHALGRPPAQGLHFPDPVSISRNQAECFVHLTSYRYRELGHARCRDYLCHTLGLSCEQAEQRLTFD